ncbi:hypothetical protein TNCV_3731621 [Trichonephila clavipes]|nr:hypothetical protein TNCV_3731621 [Trichonephila clavipes]
MFAVCGVRKEENGVLGLPLAHASLVDGRAGGPLLSIGWWYLSSSPRRDTAYRVSAADKGCRVYPLDPRPDAVPSIIFWVYFR